MDENAKGCSGLMQEIWHARLERLEDFMSLHAAECCLGEMESPISHVANRSYAICTDRVSHVQLSLISWYDVSDMYRRCICTASKTQYNVGMAPRYPNMYSRSATLKWI